MLFCYTLFVIFYEDYYCERGIIMNEFLKYLKMIPVIIYPYIYVLILFIVRRYSAGRLH